LIGWCGGLPRAAKTAKTQVTTGTSSTPRLSLALHLSAFLLLDSFLYIGSRHLILLFRTPFLL
jgi:hypothetical protein